MMPSDQNLRRLLAEHSANVHTETVGYVMLDPADQKWRTRVRCMGDCDFVAEDPISWVATGLHADHVADVLSAAGFRDHPRLRDRVGDTIGAVVSGVGARLVRLL